MSMVTKIEVAYVRRKRDYEVDSIVRRAGSTVAFLESLPIQYQTIPGAELSKLQQTQSALTTEIQQLNTHIEAIAALLPTIDTHTENLDQQSKAAYGALKAVLKGKPEAQRLDQVIPPPVKRKPKVSG